MATPLQLAPDPSPAPPLELHLESQFADLEEELTALRQEVKLLRKRDELVHFYLHRLDEELRLASRLQQDFLPKELPKIGSVRFETLFRPAGYVSGDLYDIFRLDESHVGFYVADAIGHGVPAALLTMFLRTALVTKEIFARGYHILAPGDAMGRLNSSLVAQNFTQTTFATAIYGVVDVNTLEVSLAQAGHPCPILIPADPQAKVRDIPLEGGGLLGVFPDEIYPTTAFRLSPGDRMILHSDGIEVVLEEPNFDANIWRNELARRRDSDTPQMLADFAKGLDQRSGSLQPKDDLTIIVIEANK